MKMGLKLFTTTVVILAICTAYTWIDRFDPVMVRGKRVLITGASRGIGEQMAYQYASMGAKVMVTARDEDELNLVVAKCKELSGKSQQFSVAADMSNLEDAETVIEAVKEKLGGLDILVLNHVAFGNLGWWSGKENLTAFNYRTTVNYLSYVHLVSHAMPLLEASPGSSVLVVSSIGGFMGMSFNSEYAGSKFALRGFFSSLRGQFEVLGKDIKVTICFLGVKGADRAGQLLGQQDAFRDFKAGEDYMCDIGDTALAVIKSGSLGEKEMYYPYLFKLLTLLGLESVPFQSVMNKFYGLK